jgi:hypothetical protein
MIIKGFKQFNGQHCETTATGSLLINLGINLSEPILFGLGSGLGFIFWNMKTMSFPFLGGRIKTGLLTKNITDNLNLKLEVKETSSVNKAWQNVKSSIDNGIGVGLKLDCYHLEYFTRKHHFAGHYAAMYGYDDNFAYLVDTKQQGGKVKTSLKSLELARNERGPMSSRNLSYTIHKTGKNFDLKKAIINAIKNNVNDYLNPPINNISYKGILKTSLEVKKWFKNSKNVERDFTITAMLMEKAGTGGAIFRNLYRDFLKESYELLQIEYIDQAYKMFYDIARQWKKVAVLFDKAGKTKNIECINQASEILKELSEKEKIAMEILGKI